MAHSTGMLAVMAAGSATPTATPTTTTLSPGHGHDEVDQPMDGWVETEEEVITEFHDEDNREKKQVCMHVTGYYTYYRDDPLPYIVCAR